MPLPVAALEAAAGAELDNLLDTSSEEEDDEAGEEEADEKGAQDAVSYVPVNAAPDTRLRVSSVEVAAPAGPPPPAAAAVESMEPPPQSPGLMLLEGDDEGGEVGQSKVQGSSRGPRTSPGLMLLEGSDEEEERGERKSAASAGLAVPTSPIVAKNPVPQTMSLNHAPRLFVLWVVRQHVHRLGPQHAVALRRDGRLVILAATLATAGPAFDVDEPSNGKHGQHAEHDAEDDPKGRFLHVPAAVLLSMVTCVPLPLIVRVEPLEPWF